MNPEQPRELADLPPEVHELLVSAGVELAPPGLVVPCESDFREGLLLVLGAQAVFVQKRFGAWELGWTGALGGAGPVTKVPSLTGVSLRVQLGGTQRRLGKLSDEGARVLEQVLRDAPAQVASVPEFLAPDLLAPDLPAPDKLPLPPLRMDEFVPLESLFVEDPLAEDDFFEHKAEPVSALETLREGKQLQPAPRQEPSVFAVASRSGAYALGLLMPLIVLDLVAPGVLPYWLGQPVKYALVGVAGGLGIRRAAVVPKVLLAGLIGGALYALLQTFDLYTAANAVAWALLGGTALKFAYPKQFPIKLFVVMTAFLVLSPLLSSPMDLFAGFALAWELLFVLKVALFWGIVRMVGADLKIPTPQQGA